MRIVKFFAAILLSLFLTGTGCIKPVFFQGDYELSRCPDAPKGAPHIFHRLEGTLDPSRDLPLCRDFSGYTYQRYQVTGGAIASIDGYVKLIRGKTCSVRIISRADCVVGNGRSCEDNLEQFSPQAVDSGTELVNSLWTNEEIKTKSESAKIKLIGNYEALKHWCQGRE